ncbi:MAG: tetraacyldisaccharide 4'-kinase [Burkholderiales bacterium]|jgi:tetraacyldisaccharide 4'-kinase|nr:tetraacyldisaccharide 4'-kinase [Burkholderiales bacterium]
MTKIARAFLDSWYRRDATWLAIVLLPLTILYAVVVEIRASLYRHGFLKIHPLSVPVIVVGNITVGGTGKTPFVIALVHALRERGFTPGVISRGYGGKASKRGDTLLVTEDSDPSEVGDEAVQIARVGVPMSVGTDRVEAGERLTRDYPEVNVIVADDGLQHYRLSRVAEIAVLDGVRQLGNRLCLPSGPLRERASRLAQVSAVVVTSLDDASPLPSLNTNAPLFRQILKEDALRKTNDPKTTREPASLAREKDIHAIAGIGHPERFFTMLKKLGIHATSHSFADHFPYTAADLAIPEARWIIMTEKDAVKCRVFADDRCWYLAMISQIPDPLLDLIEEKLRAAQPAN